MYVSIIIPTVNRSRLLQRTILSLTQQIYSNKYEIIVVDNGSTDDTKNVVDLVNNCCGYKIKYIYESRPGLLFGRHAGVKNAKGDILSFVDDDVIIPPFWIESIYETFQNSDVALATGNNYPYFENIIPYWLEYMWKKCEYGKQMPELSLIDFGNEPKQIDPGFVWGLNYHIKRSIFEGVGGFHPDILPEKYKFFVGDGETGISLKLKESGYKAFFNPGLSLYHTITKERMTVDYFKKRHFIQGMMNSFTCIRNEFVVTEDAKNKVRLIDRLVKKLFKFIASLDNIDREKIKMEEEIFLLMKELEIAENEGFNSHYSEANRNVLLREYIAEREYYTKLDFIYKKYFK